MSLFDLHPDSHPHVEIILRKALADHTPKPWEFVTLHFFDAGHQIGVVFERDRERKAFRASTHQGLPEFIEEVIGGLAA